MRSPVFVAFALSLILVLPSCGDASEEAGTSLPPADSDASSEAMTSDGGSAVATSSGDGSQASSATDESSDRPGSSNGSSEGSRSGGGSSSIDDEGSGQDGSDSNGESSGSDGSGSGGSSQSSGSGNSGQSSGGGDDSLAPPLEAARVFHVGHSLVNHDMPRMLEQVALETGRDHAYGVQIINGANLQWQWNNSSDAEGDDARAVLPSGDHDVLVITEAVPLDNHLTWSDTEEYAGRFYALAVDANPEARVFLYETWHCIHSGTSTGCEWDDNDDVPWRERLTADAAKWQGIVDHVNANHEGPPMRVIPVGQAMAVLHDRIAEGGVYSLDSSSQLFLDDIHLTAVGNYFVAMVHYAAIYRRSPVGLAVQTSNQWGVPFEAPHEPLAWTLQEIAWEVVSGDPAYGVLLGE